MTESRRFSTTIDVGSVSYDVSGTLSLTTTEHRGQLVEHFGMPCREPETRLEVDVDGWSAVPDQSLEDELAIIEALEEEKWRLVE